jgi:hypothetical protein
MHAVRHSSSREPVDVRGRSIYAKDNLRYPQPEGVVLSVCVSRGGSARIPVIAGRFMKPAGAPEGNRPALFEYRMTTTKEPRFSTAC